MLTIQTPMISHNFICSILYGSLSSGRMTWYFAWHCAELGVHSVAIPYILYKLYDVGAPFKLYTLSSS